MESSGTPCMSQSFTVTRHGHCRDGRADRAAWARWTTAESCAPLQMPVSEMVDSWASFPHHEHDAHQVPDHMRKTPRRIPRRRRFGSPLGRAGDCRFGAAVSIKANPNAATVPVNV